MSKPKRAALFGSLAAFSVLFLAWTAGFDFDQRGSNAFFVTSMTLAFTTMAVIFALEQ